jgi:hypothetical protein
MDNHEAREILRRHRPGTPDADAPDVREALELARRDPALAEWLEQSAAFDAAMRRELGGIRVPDKLAARILAANQRRESAGFRRSRMFAVAAAATAALAVGIGLWIRSDSEPDAFEAYSGRMARAAQRDYRMGIFSRDQSEIRKYLVQAHGAGDFTLAPGLGRLPGIGGAVLRWHDHPVSMVCLDGGNNGMLYLFVADQGSFSHAPGSAAPEFARLGKLATASWSLDGKTYLLASEESEEALRRRL